MNVLDVYIFLYKGLKFERSRLKFGIYKQLEFKAFYLNIFNSVRSRDLNYFNIQQGNPVYWNQGYTISIGISIS